MPTTMPKVLLSDPMSPQASALLHASHALMQSLFSPEENHYLEISELCAPHIRFLVAWEQDVALGCGALALYPEYGEIKSMFVAPEARGQGIAQLLLAELERLAKQQGLSTLKLETGDSLHAAHRLYEGFGFARCAAFGDYPDQPSSVFMQKPLHP